MPEKNLAVELLEKLLKDEVKARMKNDVVQEKKYSDRIMATLLKYHNRGIETAQVIEELIQWAKEMAADAEMADKLNLSTDEIAFYRALVVNEESVRELGDDTLRQLAIALTTELRKSATVIGRSETVYVPVCVILLDDCYVSGSTHLTSQVKRFS